MKQIESAFLRTGVLLAVLFVSSSAFAATFTTPFGSSAVEIYIGKRTDAGTGAHELIWKRQSDGKCKRFTLPPGDNTVIGSSKADLIKVQWVEETISCLGGETYRLAPCTPEVVTLYLKGGSGNDTMLLTDPVSEAYGENGDDLLVVVDESSVVLDGGRGNDNLESWGKTSGSLLYGGDDNDCLWVNSVPFIEGGNGTDQCNADFLGEELCEDYTACCAFGAFMGVCRP